MNTCDDIYYVEQVKKGNTAAYEVLVNKYKDLAYTIALRILKSKEDAEEIAQDAFVNAFTKIDTFNGESKFSTWLYRITFNAAISRSRKFKPDTMTINEEITELPESGLDNQLHKMSADDQKKYLGIALEKLDETDSLILTLYYLNQEKTEEIGHITGLSKSNVKVKLHRARKKLYHELQLLLKSELKTLI